MFKKIISFLTAVSAAAALGCYVYADDTAGSARSAESDHTVITVDGKRCVLTFEDDFNGTVLDSTKWEKCPEWKRQDLNNYWDNSMSYLDGKGNLIIGMSYDEERDAFLSGAVQTKGKFEQTFGYFEIRCAINNIPGYWTAFWLMTDDVVKEQNGGVDGTEIDIYESAYYSKKQIQHSLNWDGYGVARKADASVGYADVYDGEYHTFSLLWTDKEYVYYIDGQETWRTDAAKAKGTCKVPLYMIISSETGSWTGIPDAEQLPDYMKVDYVRAYSLAEDPPIVSDYLDECIKIISECR